jgi:hypothetical protein
MKKVFIGFGLVFLMVLIAVSIATTSTQVNVKDGIPTVPIDKAAYGDITFEPLTYFSDSLPLDIWVSGDVGAHFIAGHGAVLKANTFGISGYSEPNALCFNSNSTNADGTKPRLPAIIKFDPPIQYLSLKVGSATSTGLTAKIKAYSTSLSKIDEDSVSITAAMQTMTVSSGTKNIELLIILGPSVLVVDDLYFY